MSSDSIRIVAVHEAAGVPIRRDFGCALFAAMRPRQWVKNVLVFAAPAAAGVLGHGSVIAKACGAFALFVLASSGTYLVNDALDADQDRLHPVKRDRPVASGRLSRRRALSAGIAMPIMAVVGALVLSGPLLAFYMAAYVAVSAAYSLGMKRVPAVELLLVAGGFVIRAVSGGAAAHVSISPWFLTVTSAGALLVAAGKRSAELALLGQDGHAHRAVLGSYSEGFLRSVRVCSALAAAVGYGLWAFGRAALLDVVRADGDDLLVKLSVLPFVAALALLEIKMERGEGGEPEDLALRSHGLQILGGACVALVAAGIYL